MTLCPVALAVHCVGCPVVKICPAKSIIGDYASYRPLGADKKDSRPSKKFAKE